MRQTLQALAGAAIITAAYRAGISLPLFIGLFRAVKVSLNRINASVPIAIETMVDWLEAAYGGPINT
jgi:hypothetical protein